MSLSRSRSFSVRIRMPVAWGAKTCTMPFWIFDLATASWIFWVRSMNSISPLVEKVKVVLNTSNVDMTCTASDSGEATQKSFLLRWKGEGLARSHGRGGLQKENDEG